MMAHMGEHMAQSGSAAMKQSMAQCPMMKGMMERGMIEKGMKDGAEMIKPATPDTPVTPAPMPR